MLGVLIYIFYVSKFQTKLPTEGRRLPRNVDDFHLFQRYDGTPRSVDKPEPKRRRGQYIREEYHTEEHYVVTRTPLAGGKQTKETRFPARDQTEKGTQELKVGYLFMVNGRPKFLCSCNSWNLSAD
jgi:hypothetical protein